MPIVHSDWPSEENSNCLSRQQLRSCVLTVRCMSSKVPRDENGSILMLEDEVEAAFKFLDVKQTGKVTLLGLKQRFGVFYNSLPVQRIKNMMDGRHNFTLEMMKELVIDNGINDFDPVAEAFKVGSKEGGVNRVRNYEPLSRVHVVLVAGV